MRHEQLTHCTRVGGLAAVDILHPSGGLSGARQPKTRRTEVTASLFWFGMIRAVIPSQPIQCWTQKSVPTAFASTCSAGFSILRFDGTAAINPKETCHRATRQVRPSFRHHYHQKVTFEQFGAWRHWGLLRSLVRRKLITVPARFGCMELNAQLILSRKAPRECLSTSGILDPDDKKARRLVA
jgi:hypothetical protein